MHQLCLFPCGSYSWLNVKWCMHHILSPLHHIYCCMCIIYVVEVCIIFIVACASYLLSAPFCWAVLSHCAGRGLASAEVGREWKKRGNWTEGRIVNIRWRWTKKFKINLQSKVNAAKEFKLWVIFFGPDWLLSDILDPLNPMISFRIKYPSLILHFSFFCLFWP